MGCGGPIFWLLHLRSVTTGQLGVTGSVLVVFIPIALIHVGMTNERSRAARSKLSRGLQVFPSVQVRFRTLPLKPRFLFLTTQHFH